MNITWNVWNEGFHGNVFEMWLYWNKYKIKIEYRNTATNHRYFFESSFVKVETLFVLVYSDQDEISKKIKSEIII